MTTIYLIRHAEAEGNLYRIAQGQSNGLITCRGRKQIAALAKRFEDVHIDAVYSSDLLRTCSTAQGIYIPKNLPLHRVKGLREVNMGEWEGKTWQQLNMEDGEEMFHFNRQLDRWHTKGAESAAEVRDRMIATLREIAAENKGKTVACFSHGAAMRITLGSLQGLPLSAIGDTPHGDNTAVSKLEVENGEIKVIYRDDNSHLMDAGLSTFSRQSWWKDKRMMEGGEYYRSMDAQASAELKKYGITVSGGEQIAVWFGDKPVGVIQLLPDKEPGIGWVGTYFIAPECRGRYLGIPPLGQAVLYYRERGIEKIRLFCPAEYRGFFEQYGFVALEGDILELDIALKE